LDEYNTAIEIASLNAQLSEKLEAIKGIALIVLSDDSNFTTATLNNYLWVTYTRCNPSHDMYGIDSFILHKHWGCNGPLIIDARIKPHHAPPVIKDPNIEKRIDRLFEKGGSLYGILS
jgi:4-hydroxy-3-polyprenylbenzoate decarboxylase